MTPFYEDLPSTLSQNPTTLPENSLLRHEGRVYTVPGRGSYVRGAEDVSVIRLSSPARVSSRMPTAHERRQHSIPEGVPVFIIDRHTDTPSEILPADRTVIEIDGSQA